MVIDIQVAAAIIGALIAGAISMLPLINREIQSRSKRHSFQKLIFRELEEMKPFTPTVSNAGETRSWKCHLQKQFVHQAIFLRPENNLDFILTLDENLVYFLSQLWTAYDKDNVDNFVYCLREISHYMDKPEMDWYANKEKIRNLLRAWCETINRSTDKQYDDCDEAKHPINN
jgi:hypothetical protein